MKVLPLPGFKGPEAGMISSGHPTAVFGVSFGVSLRTACARTEKFHTTVSPN